MRFKRRRSIRSNIHSYPEECPEGIPKVEVHPTVLNFSEPMKTLEALVLQKQLTHDGELYARLDG